MYVVQEHLFWKGGVDHVLQTAATRPGWATFSLKHFALIQWATHRDRPSPSHVVEQRDRDISPPPPWYLTLNTRNTGKRQNTSAKSIRSKLQLPCGRTLHRSVVALCTAQHNTPHTGVRGNPELSDHISWTQSLIFLTTGRCSAG